MSKLIVVVVIMAQTVLLELPTDGKPIRDDFNWNKERERGKYVFEREREKERVNIGRRKVEIGCEDLFNEFVRVST